MTYVIDDKGGTGASGTTFDDLVLSYAVAEQMRLYDEPVQETVWLAEDLGLSDAQIETRY